MAAPPDPEHYDALVLGSGEAGKYIAWHLASANKRVALIERQYVGGSCPNIACLPSKNVIHSAYLAHEARKAASAGILPLSDDKQIDMAAVRQRKRAMVAGLIETQKGKFAQTGTELVWGSGRFVAPRTLAVTADGQPERVLSADVVVVSTGSRAFIDPSIPGLAEAVPLTHVELLELGKAPPHVVILGGGYSGLEFAQALRRLGSEVTVIERHGRVLKQEDEDVAAALAAILSGEGVRFVTSAAVSQVSGRSGEAVTVTVKHPHQEQAVEIKGTHLLVTTGRTPNTDHMDAAKAGVALTPTGHVSVDGHLRSTSSEGVFAVGDCAGSPHFTHIAYDDFRIVRDVLAGTANPRSTAGRQVPHCLFTSPELARIGLTEADAKRAGISYRLGKLPMKMFLRTRTLGQEEGFAKVLVEAEGDLILGFVALGVGAGELLPVVQLAMVEGLGFERVRDLIITHPTLAEGLVFLFSTVPARG